MKIGDPMSLRHPVAFVSVFVLFIGVYRRVCVCLSIYLSVCMYRCV